jgi:predicted DNA-binding transcriptional regulator AlpA
MEKFYNAKEFQKLTGMTRPTILKLIDRGMPCIQLEKYGTMRFSKEAFEWIKKNCKRK